MSETAWQDRQRKEMEQELNRVYASEYRLSPGGLTGPDPDTHGISPNPSSGPRLDNNYDGRWGEPDTVHYQDGIAWISTPRHGGFVLSSARNAEIPDYMRRADRTYEEDCDWCIPALIHRDTCAELISPGETVKMVEFALATLKAWHTEAHARYTFERDQ